MKKLILILLLSSPFVLNAQFIGGNGISIVNASGDFGETHGVGVGITGNLEYKISKIALIFETAYTVWSGEEALGSTFENVSSLSFMGGIKFGLIGPVYIEARAGYYTGDLDEFAVIPAIGVRLKKLDFNLGHNIQDPTQFTNFRFVYFWN